MNNDKVFRECGTGWGKLIDPLIAKANQSGATVDQIKEKWGELRFYFTPGPSEEADIELTEMVEDATRESRRTCEICGARGSMYSSGGWLKTLCEDDAKLLNYRKKA
jgi:hypothetical protein